MKTIHRLNTALLKYIFIDSFTQELKLSFINDLLSINKDYKPLNSLRLATWKSVSPLNSICNGGNLYTIFKFENTGELDLIFHGNYMDQTSEFVLETFDPRYFTSLIMAAVNHKMYTLRIVDFNLFGSDDEYYRDSQCLWNDVKMDNFISITYEIPQFERFKEKYNKKISELTKIERWLAYFSRKTTEDEILELGKIDDRIAKAISFEKEFFENENNIIEYEKIEKENFEAIAETEKVLEEKENRKK